MQDQFVAITYTGKFNPHPDNVMHNRARVWEPGHSKRIPLAEMDKYLAHPGEYCLATPLLLLSPASQVLSEHEQVAALLQIVDNLDLDAAQEVLAAAQARVESVAKPQKLPVDPKDRARFLERREKIRGAVSLMDDTSHEHYTDTGKPRVEVVREKAGIDDVTAAEIADAIK